MNTGQLIRRIRKYSTISFLLPLIAINLCLVFYKILGDINHHPNYDYNNWKNKKEILLDIEDYNSAKEDKSFINCSKFKIIHTVSSPEGKRLIKITDEIDDRCVKNHKFLYFLLKNFNSFEKLLLYTKKNNKLFSKIENPYIHGEVSISRTARYFPATLIFKPLIILSAIFLFIYWKNNLNLFKKFESVNILNKFSKKFFYFGILSCIFLALHATFLGVDFDSNWFAKARKLIIISFILFEIFAQVTLTKSLFEFREKLKEYIHPLILKIKVTFVVIVFLSTCIAFSILAFGDPSTGFKHTLEWNYFAFLLLYYLLSRLLWKSPKNQKS